MSDAFVMDKVRNHNPSFGYNTFGGYIEENVARAMDQIISERFDVHRNPHGRWLDEDDGMHVFAAAVYSVVTEDYATAREPIREILLREITAGKLRPGNIQSVYDDFYSGYDRRSILIASALTLIGCAGIGLLALGISLVLGRLILQRRAIE